MDIPGVNLYIDNKKVFPLLSTGIQQKMPEPHEFRGVPLTGHKVNMHSCFEMKDDKYLLPEKVNGLIYSRSGKLQSEREMDGCFHDFPAVTFSQIVGGFVGSKSQIRSVNREACQIWDVIFRQLAETACQSSCVRNGSHQYYNFGKTFSQKLFNSFYQGSRCTLDGLASYFISKNCEFLHEQKMIETVSELEFKGKDLPMKLSTVNSCEKVPRSTLNSDNAYCFSLVMDNFSTMNLTANSKLLCNIPKQSYAEVAKSYTSKGENHSVTQQPNHLPVFNKSSKIAKKLGNSQSKESSLITSKFCSTIEQSEQVLLTHESTRKRRRKRSRKHEDKFKLSERKDTKLRGVSRNLEIEMSYDSPEGCNWRERKEPIDCIQQRLPGRYNQYKTFNAVYPAFSRKGRSVDVNSHRSYDSFQCSNKRSASGTYTIVQKSGEFEGKVQNDSNCVEVPQFGRMLKSISKDLYLRKEDIQARKEYCKGKIMHNLKTPSRAPGLCSNWRCKHNRIVSGDSFDCEKVVNTRKDISVMTDSSSEPSVGENMIIINEDSVRSDSFEDQSPIGKEVCPNLSSEPSSVSVSDPCVDNHVAGECRRRFLSECSVDSEDSFVVFESECQEDVSLADLDASLYQCTSLDTDTSDSWSECGSEDESIGGTDDHSDDEIDFCFVPSSSPIPEENCQYTDNVYSPLSDRLKDINEKWMKENASLSCRDKSPEKVHFVDNQNLATVHTMVKWDFAYRAARCGPWEEMARDRSRFQTRIFRAEAVLSPILTTEHRCKVQRRMISSAIT